MGEVIHHRLKLLIWFALESLVLPSSLLSFAAQVCCDTCRSDITKGCTEMFKITESSLSKTLNPGIIV